MPTRRRSVKALYPLSAVALLVLSLGADSWRPIRAAPVALPGAAPPQGLLNPHGTLDSATGFPGTLEVGDWQATLDGEPGPALKPAAGSAIPSTPGWHALANQGLDKTVYALATVGSDLYVGGVFARTGDGAIGDLTAVARYDTTVGAWQALNNRGLDNTVHALAVVGSDLYVGGRFTRTGDGSLTNLGRIARYDTTTGTWYALNNGGLDDAVLELSVVGSDLYVGGDFDLTGDGSLTNLGRVARYDTTTGTWHPLNNEGLDDTVHALAMEGSDLYVGGAFTQTGDGSLTSLGRIARYDTTTGTWHALNNQGLNNWVEALVMVGSDLYVGGVFNQTADFALPLGHIARYDTTGGTWHALRNEGLDGYALTLELVGSDLYVGGSFVQTEDGALSLNRIARYKTPTGTWRALRNKGLDAAVHALVASGDDLYTGGWFAQTGDGSLTGLGRVAHYYEVDYLVYLPLITR